MSEYFNHNHRHHPRHRNLLRYFRDNLATVVGLVLIWRGIWYVLDGIDLHLFGDSSHILSAVGGIMLGLVILYLPDHDLKEIQKL